MHKKTISCLLAIVTIIQGEVPMLVASKNEKEGVIYFSPDKEVSQKLLQAKMMYGGHDPDDINRIKKEHPGKVHEINFSIKMINGKPTLIQD